MIFSEERQACVRGPNEAVAENDQDQVDWRGAGCASRLPVVFLGRTALRLHRTG
jgi:hypothetical protein